MLWRGIVGVRADLWARLAGQTVVFWAVFERDSQHSTKVFPGDSHWGTLSVNVLDVVGPLVAKEAGVGVVCWASGFGGV